MKKLHVFSLLGIMLSSCASYKQNIMFKSDGPQGLQKLAREAESNYTIQKNDFLELEVYTNQGEKIIDPNLESFKESGQPASSENTKKVYLVDVNGLVKLPMLQEIKLEGLTIRQAEQVLQKEYARFYEEPFVRLMFTNKRVIVLGAPGGLVIPLTNDNIRLTEVLALAKGIGNDAKAHNIRVLRGDTMFTADFSTFQGYLDSNLVMLPGDVVYIEPIRRPFTEAFRDYGPLLSIVTSLGTLVIVILQFNKA